METSAFNTLNISAIFQAHNLHYFQTFKQHYVLACTTQSILIHPYDTCTCHVDTLCEYPHVCMRHRHTRTYRHTRAHINTRAYINTRVYINTHTILYLYRATVCTTFTYCSSIELVQLDVQSIFKQFRINPLHLQWNRPANEHAELTIKLYTLPILLVLVLINAEPK